MTRDNSEWSRRDVFKAAAGIAAVPLLWRNADAAQQPPATADSGTLDRAWRQAAPPPAILLKGGTIISMDAKVGDFASGDVLIQGTKIVSVGPSGQAKAPAQAQVIDATNTIIIPGFVDPHRHSWEG